MTHVVKTSRGNTRRAKNRPGPQREAVVRALESIFTEATLLPGASSDGTLSEQLMIRISLPAATIAAVLAIYDASREQGPLQARIVRSLGMIRELTRGMQPAPAAKEPLGHKLVPDFKPRNPGDRFYETDMTRVSL